MKINRLDHVNILTSNLSQMVEWYERVLGISSGRRPNFPTPGAWLYVGDDPIIHLSEVAEEPAAKSPKIEHFALHASGLKTLVERLNNEGIPHTLDQVPGLPIVQVNLRDCDGNHIHVDFTSETV